MKLTVIKVTGRDGKQGYLVSANLFGAREHIVENPLDAKNYANPKHAGELEEDLDLLKMPGDEIVYNSGFPVETAHVVELEVQLTEVSSREGRPPRKSR